MSAKARKSLRKDGKLSDRSRFAGDSSERLPWSDWGPVAVAVLLVAITLAVYWPVFGNGFVYDDEKYVTHNPHVLMGLNPRTVAWAFTAIVTSNWHPLTLLSHALDCTLYALCPTGHHLTNLLFHMANVLLLFWVLARMTGVRRGVWRSGFVAALFAVHPLHVESVAWISERKDVLSTFFWLLTMLAYARYVERPGLGRYLLIVPAFALGLMSKPMLVSLPIVLLFMDWWPLGRLAGACNRTSTFNLQPSTLKGLILEKIPLFVLSAASCAVAFIAQKTGGAVAQLESYPFSSRIANAIVSYASYILKMFWPARLAAHYPYVNHLPIWQVTLAAVFLVAVTVFVLRVRSASGDRGESADPPAADYLAVGWLWYLVTLVPVIGLVQVGGQSMADRYTYVPLIGIFIMIAWGVPDLIGRFAPSARAALPVAAGIAIVALAVPARTQVGYWKDTVTLWEHAIAVTTNNPRAQYDLASALLDQGKLEEAALHFDLAIILGQQGELNEATHHHIQAVRLHQAYARAHNDLGATLWKAGKSEEAGRHFAEAVRIDPNYAEAHNNLGTVLSSQGKVDEAAKEYSEAIRLKPDYAMAHCNLATAHYSKGEYAAAWKEIHLCREFGGSPPPAFVRMLSHPPRRTYPGN